jgi:tRNA threonylcarbamoyladenosine biosynthesis protein TsaB
VKILALDTTTLPGSSALMCDGELEGWMAGDPTKTHSERLPGDLLRLLEKHGLRVDDVDLFAVCAGPGSFTGLRVGLATVQGLALASGGHVLGVSTLEVLAHAGLWGLADEVARPSAIIPWMNAQRGEVFAAIYAVRDRSELELQHGPVVGAADDLLTSWADEITGPRTLFVGDAVAEPVSESVPGAVLEPELPALAPVVARLADEKGLSVAVAPHAIRPVYVRRPDAEIARERGVSLKRP